MTRGAALLWFGFAALMFAIFLDEIMDEQRPGSLFIAATFGVTSAWLGRGLWRGPSFAVVVISVCVAAFVTFLFLIPLVDGSATSLWILAIPLMPAVAAILALMSKATSR